MKTSEKIRALCKQKYGISVSVYEKKMGYANGSLTKKGDILSNRLFAVARDLGVSMEDLIDDDLLATHELKADLDIPFSDDEINMIEAFRKKGKETQDNIRLLLGIKPKKNI